jgi:hypothetical protein
MSNALGLGERNDVRTRSAAFSLRRPLFVTTSGISLESDKNHPCKKSKTTAKNFWSGLEFLERL